MNPRTVATLEELSAADWFVSVGKSDSNAAIVLKDWKTADNHCSSEEWKALCNEAANQYRARVAEIDPARLKVWNEIVREVKAVTAPLVVAKTAAVAKEGKLTVRSLD